MPSAGKKKDAIQATVLAERKHARKHGRFVSEVTLVLKVKLQR